MKIVGPKETTVDERRVGIVPVTVERLLKSGHEVAVQMSAGEAAGFGDEDYKAAGAHIVEHIAEWTESSVVVLAKVQAPTLEEADSLMAGSIAIAFMNAHKDTETLEKLTSARVTALAMDLVPRIARAQNIDALSSQASLAGYKAVLVAANSLEKYFPMLITAAGAVPPAKVLVLGAGVAGLQAVATAHRLGAVVEAFDVRATVREQVESLGAKFISPSSDVNAEGSGGYAQEQTTDEQERIRDFLRPYVASADAVIATAAVPGKRAPLLITIGMVETMSRGSVIVDLAAETGGNCEATKPGSTVLLGDVQVHGQVDFPSQVAKQASMLYARNIEALISLMSDKDGTVKVDLNDEVVSAMCVTHDGETRIRMKVSD